MGYVPTSNLSAWFANTEPGQVADATKIDPAVQDIVNTVNDNFDFVTGLISTGNLNRLGVVNVMEFGAKGDGVTDDYQAIKNAVNAINNVGGGSVIFPPGTYYIGQYKTSTNGVTDIEFKNCDGLIIQGYGATINLNGNFSRISPDDATVIPFKLINCKRVSIEGFECDGNVDKMTRTSDLVEGPSYGIWIGSCVDVKLENLYLHHFATDGITIRDDAIQINPRVASKNVTSINVKCEYNARQGISIGQLRRGIFINCNFDYTGRSSGSYGIHSPASGCDIEPNRNTSTPSPNQMDINTGEILFIKCTSQENAGATFLCSEYDNVDDVQIFGSKFIVGSGGTTGSDGFIMDCPSGRIYGSYFDMSANRCYLGWVTNDISDIIADGCTFTGNGRILVSLVNVNVTIKNSRIIGTHTTSFDSFVPQLANTKLKIMETDIFVPGLASNGTAQVINQFGVEKSSGNTFSTDLATGGAAYFVTFYASSTYVHNDRFLSGDAFRPLTGSIFDTTRPYTKAEYHVGEKMLIGSSERTKIVQILTAPPSSGTYARGDFVFNASPTAGSPFAWMCTTAGSPGIWTPIQLGVMASISAAPTFIGQLASVGGVGYMATGTSSTADWKQITN